MSAIDAGTVKEVWIATLVVYAVVLIVVAALLTLVLRAARDVTRGVSAIWTVGQQVANNTIHVALLDTTNHAVARILESAKGVAAATTAMRTHAMGCPGCPACVLAR
jgi:sulfite reductase beta subunit-like hemoprotein